VVAGSADALTLATTLGTAKSAIISSASTLSADATTLSLQSEASLSSSVQSYSNLLNSYTSLVDTLSKYSLHHRLFNLSLTLATHSLFPLSSFCTSRHRCGSIGLCICSPRTTRSKLSQHSSDTCRPIIC
jgi:hypothetical protein